MVLLFNRNYLRFNVNIQDCFTLERKGKLVSVMDRPWANGLNRLLAERRGLKKGKLAELCPGDKPGKSMRAPLISSVLNSDAAPSVETLQRLATGLTRYDRKLNPKAPDVELWEFFVSDEQAAALRDRAVKVQTESADEALLARAVDVFAASLRQAREEQAPPIAPPQPVVVPRTKQRAK